MRAKLLYHSQDSSSVAAVWMGWLFRNEGGFQATGLGLSEHPVFKLVVCETLAEGVRRSVHQYSISGSMARMPDLSEFLNWHKICPTKVIASTLICQPNSVAKSNTDYEAQEETFDPYPNRPSPPALPTSLMISCLHAPWNESLRQLLPFRLHWLSWKAYIRRRISINS